MQEQIMHREVVAALASYKAALRSAAIAFSQKQEPARLKTALERATTACAAAQKCLQTVSDQRLPLDTSRRLADIDLPALVQQLLQAAVDSHLVEGSNAAPADSAEAAAAGTTPAPTAASWADVQGCITECFECLALLAAVACRACTRSNDPLLVLEQLAAPGLANSSVAFMQHIMEVTTAADSVVRAAAVAAPCAYYGPFAAAVDPQGVLQPVRTQLSATLSSSMYLPAAAALLLAARGPAAPAKVAQQGAHHLLTIALLLSGDSLLTAWHLDSPTTAAANTAAEAAAAAAAGGSQPLCEQLVAPAVLEFLEERLYHAALELHCSSATPDLDASIGLLPGRAVLDGGMELQAAALRALRCWRAILRSGAAARARFAATPRTSQLLLSALSAVLADPVRAGSTDRQSLRSRVCKVCIDCLQMLTARLAPDALLAVLRPLLVDCTDMLLSVAQFVDVHKHAAKSSELPLSARLKTMDRGTADVVQRYCATAEQAVDIVQAVLRATASSEEPSPLTSACVGVLMASGMLPALEGVFRTIPPACQAQVAAAELLVHLLPHYPFGAGTDAAGDQAMLSLLITLRKFIINCANLPEPDRELGVHVALAAEALLTRLVSSAASATAERPHPSSGPADSLVCTGDQALLLRHAMQQLLPAIQAMCTVLLKVPAAGTVMCGQSGSAQHLFLYLFKLLRSVAQLHDQRPDLQLLPLLAAHGSLPLAAAMLGTGFYATPQGFSLLGELPSACSLGTREYLAKQVLQLLEVCIAHISAPATPAPAPASRLPDPVKPNAEQGMLVVDVVVEAGPEARSPSPPTPKMAPAAEAGSEVWRAALLRGLLHSRLLPEVQRLLLQLGAGTHTSDECVGAAVMGALSEMGAMRRPDSSSLLSPATSGNLLERGGSGRLMGRPVQKSDSWSGLQSAISSSLNSTRSDGLAGTYSQPSTPAASAGTSTGLRDSLPIPGVSMPPINTRPLQREGSGGIGAGLLRGTSPTAFSAGLATRGGGGTRSRGATPVAGSSAMGASFGSLSSMGSGFWGGALSSPVGTASNAYFDSLLKTSAVAMNSARAEGSTADGAQLAATDTVLAALQHRLDRLLVATGRQVLEAVQKAGDLPAVVGGGISRQGSGAAAAAAPAPGGIFAATAVPPAPVSPAGPQQEAGRLHKAMAAMVLPTPALSKLSDALKASPAATPGSSPRAGAGDTSPAATGPRAADRFNMLRSALAAAVDTLAAQDAAAAAAAQEAGASQMLSEQGSVNSVTAGMSGGGAMEAAGDGGLFPLELRSMPSSMGASPPEGGLLAAAITSSPVPAAQAGGVSAAAEVAAVLPPALLRRLLAALAAATPPAVQLLDKTASTLCVDAVCSQVRPLPLGCWNPGCTLLVGLSESKAMLRPCSGCSVAVYCSKACEKAAWPTSHKGACSSLKAQAEAGLLQAPVLPEPVVRRSSAGLGDPRGPLLGPRMARMSSGL